jgi:hypothetical protein
MGRILGESFAKPKELFFFRNYESAEYLARKHLIHHIGLTSERDLATGLDLFHVDDIV